MRIFFTFILALIFAFQSWSDTKNKAVLSYALPSKLDWKQLAEEEYGKDSQVFTLGDNDKIRMYSVQIGNENLWESFSKMDKDTLFKELVEGKKIVHTLAGYKNWTADKSMNRKSDKEIIFEITGSYIDEKEKKFFVEKYYMTPVGFILISLDWTDKADMALAKKAQDEFKGVVFNTEIK